MKTKLLKVFFLLLFFTLLLSGCRDEVVPYYNCIRECDELQAKYLTDYEDCRKQCKDARDEAIDECPTENDIIALACLKRAILAYDICIAECDETFESRMEEVRQCRIECNKLITISEE